MKITDKFSPNDEIMSKLSYREQKKVNVILTGDFFCLIMFATFAVALFAIAKHLTGTLMIAMCLSFLISMISIKKGHLVIGSYVTSVGLFISVFIIAFFTSYIENSAVCYRTACFGITICVLNYMAAIKKRQLVVFLIGIIGLEVVSVLIRYYPQAFASDPQKWISDLIINIVAILTANLILIASDASNERIVAHSEKEHEQVADNLGTITNVLNQVKESLNVGQKLNAAADTASMSVEAINSVYQTLIDDTNKLNSQSDNISKSSQVVTDKAQYMYNGISQQNQSLAEISSAVTQISSNISNINGIAQKRHEGMNEVTKLINSQGILIEKIVEDVDKVGESSTHIAEFVKTVDNIAQQTNLLAMNASIEAAHAGENGKGFGVIAQEIRKLSEETTTNAKKISDTLQLNTVIVKETTESVTAFAEATQKTAAEIRENFNSLEEILSGITEMNNGSQDIMNSVNKVVYVADENTKVIDEVVKQISSQRNDIEEISNAATSLHERVNFVSQMLPQISEAMEAVHVSAKENDEVSGKIAQLLK